MVRFFYLNVKLNIYMCNERQNGQNSVATSAQKERQIIKAGLIKAIESKHYEPIEDTEYWSNITIGATKPGRSNYYHIVLKGNGKWLSNKHIFDTDNLINEATDFLVEQIEYWFY